MKGNTGLRLGVLFWVWALCLPAFVAEGQVFVGEWGTYGSGDGEFFDPESIAVDASDNVFVADTKNHRIQKFTGDGVFLKKWGTAGSGDGQSARPRGVAVDRVGNIYVTDSDNSRIQKFTSEGLFLKKWGTGGNGNGEFSSPRGIAVDSSDNVYVAEEGNNRIQKFTSEGAFLRKWGRSGSGDGEFSGAWGLAVDSSGSVYVGEIHGNRIQKFTSEGVFLKKWGSFGTSDGKFLSPFGVATDSSDNVYVADSGNRRIQKFTSDGVFLSKWGGAGSGEGQFNTPLGVAVHSSGNVYVVDFGRQCILKFRSEVSPDDLEITTTSLPDGIEGQPYDQTLQAGGGVTPYTWSIASGNLPDGLSLYSGTGVISGTPTENGAFSFTVWVNDSQSPADTDTTLFDLHITPPDLEIMTTSLPGGVEGQAYSHTLEATGGVKPYNWNIVSGSLPDGLSLDASTGVIGGTATNAAIGISTFTVRVIDSQSTGDTIYIFGGLHDYLHLGPCLTSTEKYDSLSDTWMVVSPMNEARGNPGFATDDQGRIYAIAGWRMDGGVLSSVERYDMRRDLWEYVAPLPIRSGNPSAFTLNGEIYAVGGWKPGYTNECFIYSPDTDTWRGGPSMYEPVGVAGAVVASSGMPYLIGGQGPGIEARDRVSMLVDEDSELVWEATTSLQSLRVSPGVTLGLDGFIYALGGATGTTTGSAVNTVERFDEGTQTWSYIEPMTRRRMELEAVTDSLGRIWSVGGTDGDVGLDSVECYDPATGSWTMMTSHLNTGRGGHGIAIVSRKRQTDEEELSITIRPQRPIVTKEGDVVTVTWGDFGDGYYRVEWTDDLVSGIWQTPVGTWPISDLMWMDIVSNDVMQRFYRVESGGLYTDPVGFVKVVTVQGGFTMLSVPLLPADNRLNGDSGCIGDMIAAVLTGGPSADEADMIWRWDPDSENYGRVYLISGRGEGYDGKWWDDERGDFSTMTLDVGECCWILRRARQ